MEGKTYKQVYREYPDINELVLDRCLFDPDEELLDYAAYVSARREEESASVKEAQPCEHGCFVDWTLLSYDEGIMLEVSRLAEVWKENCYYGYTTVSYTHLTLPTTPYV